MATGKQEWGFTLIEVLVALVVLAIALLAVIKVSAQAVGETARLKQKIGAHWLALNVAAWEQLRLLSVDKGSQRMLGMRYDWRYHKDTPLTAIQVWSGDHRWLILSLPDNRHAD